MSYDKRKQKIKTASKQAYALDFCRNIRQDLTKCE